MISLIASFFSLFVGPLIYQTFGPLKRTDKIVGGVVLVVVSGMILIEVLPQTYQAIGMLTPIVALIGFLGPTLIEKLFRKAANTTHKFTIFLGLSGLIIHAMLDGLAVKIDAQNHTHHLSMAVIMHRLPVGLTIWWMLKPILGEKSALAFLLGMGIATFIGYAWGNALNDYQQSAGFAALQALIAGSLLHVVVHKPYSDGCMHTSETHEKLHQAQHQQHKHNHPHSFASKVFYRWENLGYLLGIFLLVVGFGHQH